MATDGPVYEFGSFRLDVRERRLVRDGHPIPLATKVFETLRITVTAGTGVLVTSGNPSFTKGARRELLDWLQALMRALEESPK